MCDWIEIPIFCNNDKTQSLVDLNIDVADDQYDIRVGSIDTDKIIGFYPDSENKTTILRVIDDTFEINLTYDQFKLKLKQALK